MACTVYTVQTYAASDRGTHDEQPVQGRHMTVTLEDQEAGERDWVQG